MQANFLLLITAAIWGFAFVAQRMGMNHMGPLTFNAVRFSLGALVLLPFGRWQRRRASTLPDLPVHQWLLPGLLTGGALFLGATAQQIGIVGATAGKAGFITGLYVILVPLLALTWGRRTHPSHWAGALLAVTGLYLLTIRQNFTISPYDLLLLVGAFVWAGHVHLIDRFSGLVGPIRLSILQFAICGTLSAVGAFWFETPQWDHLIGGIGPLLYGAFLSVGLAYTLQVIAQRRADPAHAAVLLSLEGAFAALGGWLVLGEVLRLRDWTGCALILAGSLVSQLLGRKKRPPGHSEGLPGGQPEGMG